MASQNDKVKILINKSDEIIDEIFSTKTSLESFLHTARYLIGYDFRNMALIWAQNPDAKCVMGVDAIKKLNIDIPQNAVGVYLLVPVVTVINPGVVKIDSKTGCALADKSTQVYIYEEQPEYDCCFSVVSAYSLPDIPEKYKPHIDAGDIYNRLKEHGAEIKKVPASELKGVEPGFYDPESNQIRIKETLTDDIFCQELIRTYADAQFIDVEETVINQIMKDITKILCLFFFNYTADVDCRDLFVRLFPEITNLNHQEKVKVLSKAIQSATDIIMDMHDYVLSICQIGICNSVIHADNAADAIFMLATCKEFSDDEILDDAINNLIDICCMVKFSWYEQLCEDIRNTKLFSFPPYRIEVDEMTSLQDVNIVDDDDDDSFTVISDEMSTGDISDIDELNTESMSDEEMAFYDSDCINGFSAEDVPDEDISDNVPDEFDNTENDT